jgi:hypothetical protein
VNKTIARAGATLALCLFVIPAFAGKKDDPKKAGPTCPACKMALSKTKTDKDPVAVKLTSKSKVMYCCSGCKMDPKIVVKEKKKSDTKM